MFEIEKFYSCKNLLESLDKFFDDSINILHCISALEAKLNNKITELDEIKRKYANLMISVNETYNAIAESSLEIEYARDAVRKKLNHGIYDDIN